MSSKKSSERVSKRADQAGTTGDDRSGKTAKPAARKRRRSRLEIPAEDGTIVATEPNQGPVVADQGAAVAGPNTRLSALDAAAQVLGGLLAADASQGLSALELIERMAAEGLWTSPGGKTPAATLFAAMTREINAKPTTSRLQKLGRGRFASGSVAATPVARSDRSRSKS